MPVSCRDLKMFSGALATDSSDETQLRASISRAYYATFHALLPLAERLPKSAICRKDATHVTHQELSERYFEWRTSGVHPQLARLKTTATQIAKATEVSRALRVKADYRLAATVTLGDAKSQIERTQRILVAVTQIGSAMSSAPNPTPASPAPVN